MKIECLMQQEAIRETVKARRRSQNRRKRPEEILCQLLNSFGPAERQAIAKRLQ